MAKKSKTKRMTMKEFEGSKADRKVDKKEMNRINKKKGKRA